MKPPARRVAACRIHRSPCESGSVLLTTPRLRLRELTAEDRPALAGILQDAETMHAYEGPFDDAGVDMWLARQMQGYVRNGHGLWAVETADTGTFVGQCGVTWQRVEEASVLEVGYLFDRRHWGNGYAIEAARASRDWAFRERDAAAVWSIVRDTNLASMNVAIRNGMTARRRFVKRYRGVDMPHIAFAVDRAEWASAAGRTTPPRP